MKNVKTAQLHNYQKVGDDYLAVSTPYDYLSIMHYGKNYFAKTVNVCIPQLSKAVYAL